jgi:hypothetical protein
MSHPLPDPEQHEQSVGGTYHLVLGQFGGGGGGGITSPSQYGRSTSSSSASLRSTSSSSADSIALLQWCTLSMRCKFSAHGCVIVFESHGGSSYSKLWLEVDESLRPGGMPSPIASPIVIINKLKITFIVYEAQYFLGTLGDIFFRFFA